MKTIGRILYGVRKGDEDWQEQIITTCEDRIAEAQKWAQANGFNRFRIATITDEPPDFTKVFSR